MGGLILKSRTIVGVPILVLSAVIWEIGRMCSTPGAGRTRARQLLLMTVLTVGVSLAALAISLLGRQSDWLR